MAVEHAMFKFGDLKVTSRDDRMTDRMTTKVHSSRRPRSSAARPKMNQIRILTGILFVLLVAFSVASFQTYPENKVL